MEERLCVVCGQGSHRTDWIRKSKDGKHVACDGHTQEEFDKAVAAKTPTPAPASTKLTQKTNGESS